MNRRQDTRAVVFMPAIVGGSRDEIEVQMVDVSYRGLSVRMTSPPPLRRLVTIGVQLPHRFLEVHASVARSVRRADGIFDVGLRLFAVSGHERRDWEAFVTYRLKAAA